jgi:photosystem II stability/assembly factor-like uncharacterized protein
MSTRSRATPPLLPAALIVAALWPHLTRAADEPSVPARDARVRNEQAASVNRLPVTLALSVTGGTWVSQGPGPIFNGQVEGITNGHVLGAIHAIVAHPTNADVVWIGAVNGGIWKTTNATNATPSWIPSGDAFSSLSIGALNLDPTDATSNTLVGGIGIFSSFGGAGGPRAGLLRTTNGGTNWTALAPVALVGANLNGIAARGATIVVSINYADNFSCGNIGIFRSIDTGGTFSIVSGAGGTGLPQGTAFDLVGDPTNNAILYTATKYAPLCSGGVNGVYKSTDTGASWTKVSNAAMDAMLTDTANAANTRIAVGMSGEVYAGIIGSNGRLAGLFRSATGGSSWTQLDTPSTNEGGSIIGIQPEESGGQGGTHFSIVADPTNANIVYVGGDRQPLTGDGAASNPNSIGASNYTGRLFRVNAAAGAGSMSTALTHCKFATAACNSTTSTANNSAPHADSRRMVFDAGGNILESDDGGIYRRTNPRTTGDWFSVMGNLRVTEMHDVAYDRVSKNHRGRDGLEPDQPGRRRRRRRGRLHLRHSVHTVLECPGAGRISTAYRQFIGCGHVIHVSRADRDRRRSRVPGPVLHAHRSKCRLRDAIAHRRVQRSLRVPRPRRHHRCPGIQQSGRGHRLWRNGQRRRQPQSDLRNLVRRTESRERLCADVRQRGSGADRDLARIEFALRHRRRSRELAQRLRGQCHRPSLLDPE